jgi:alpha-beta hydrolase superfamily lysophospholipase
MSNKPARITLIIIFILSVNLLIIHLYTRKLMDNVVFMVTPARTLPSAIGSTYKEIHLTHGERSTRAWVTLPATIKANNPAVIIFRGFGESLSDWIWFQKMLADSGIVAVAFDYGPQTDTANRKGSSRLSEVTKDVQAIIDSVQFICGNSPKLFLLGHSVGNAVMLEMYPSIDVPFIKGVIVCNAFASMKAWSVYHHQLSPTAAFILPDYYDNTLRIGRVRQPILLLHSKADSVNYFPDALQIYEKTRAQQQDARFITFGKYDHNYIYGRDHFDYWEPIMQFIRLRSGKQ